MPALAIDGTTVGVLAESVTVEYRDIDGKRRRFSGKMSSATRGANARARVWSVEAGLLTDTEASDLEVALQAPGYVSASGDIIGATVTCEAQNISRADGAVSDIVTVSFELLEVL